VVKESRNPNPKMPQLMINNKIKMNPRKSPNNHVSSVMVIIGPMNVQNIGLLKNELKLRKITNVVFPA
jgi:hypothetical protein